ncbi:MAG: acylphosphatase [Erythrobacter sp.]
MIAKHVILHGKVQGVFYRDWSVENARKLGIAGWVQNLRDGTVEAHLEGSDEAVRTMIERMHDGPPHAEVERIVENAVTSEGVEGFDRR